MKLVIIIALAVVLLISLGSSNTSYAATGIEGMDLELVAWKKIESDKSDVLILTISFINNGKLASDIIPYVYLIDSQNRTFESVYYSHLLEKGFQVTINDCPYVPLTSSNPGLSSEEIFCYEVPKGIGDSFSLDLWSDLPGLCQYDECTIKSFPVTISQQSEHNNPTSKIPDWIKSIFLWYGQDIISEDQLLSAIKYLIDEKILIVE